MTGSSTNTLDWLALACLVAATGCNAITGVGDLQFDLQPDSGSRDADASLGSDAEGGGTGKPKPDGPTEAGCPQPPADCSACQDTSHGQCECRIAFSACATNADCAKIVQCVANGEGGAGPCSVGTTADAMCVKACASRYPNGREVYLQTERCVACGYCLEACANVEYCTELNR